MNLKDQKLMRFNLNERAYFAIVEHEFNYCELYRPYGGFYVDCRNFCNEFSAKDIVEGVDTVSSVRSAKYVAAFSPGDRINEDLAWEKEKTHFFREDNHDVPDRKCWPRSIWWPAGRPGVIGIVRFVAIKQANDDGTVAYGWIKLDYRQPEEAAWYGHAAFVHETYIQIH